MMTNKDGDILGFSGNPKTIKTISMRMITLLQDYKRGDLVIALAVLWLGICERFNFEPAHALGINTYGKGGGMDVNASLIVDLDSKRIEVRISLLSLIFLLKIVG